MPKEAPDVNSEYDGRLLLRGYCFGLGNRYQPT
jgi:hypothetical protein